MKLADYLDWKGVPAGDFARRIGVNERESVRRYIAGTRIPAPAVMRKIMAETDGAVTANDFFIAAEA